MLLVVEGEKTEPEYFKWLNKRLAGIALTVMHRQSAPERVVAYALELRDGETRASRSARDVDMYDEVWCVMDVDTHAHLDAALQTAKDADLNVALSGPCFETWLTLHLRDHTQYLDPQANKKLWASTRQKRSVTDGVLSGHLGEALQRVASLTARHDRNRVPRAERNPSTEIDAIIRAIAGHLGQAPERLY